MSDIPLKNFLKSATDPLKGGPNAGKELAKRIGKTADGFSKEHVVEASIIMFLDLMRQSHATRDKAHQKLDELNHLMHTLLDQHYNLVTGRRKAIFAWDQTVNMNFTDDRKRG